MTEDQFNRGAQKGHIAFLEMQLAGECKNGVGGRIERNPKMKKNGENRFGASTIAPSRYKHSLKTSPTPPISGRAYVPHR